MKKKLFSGYKLRKKWNVLALTAVLSFGSIYIPQSAFPTNSVSTTVKAAATKITSASITKKTTTKNFKSASGTVLFEGSYQKPVLSGSTAGIKKINSFYTSAQKKYFSDYQKQSSKEFSQEEDSIKDSAPYGDSLKTKVTYNGNGIISILQTGYFYSGGAHGMPYRVAHTFDLNTGNELKLTDIMKGTNTTIKNKIIAAFKTKLANFDGAYDDALQTVKKTASTKSPFYLQKNKITFYYAPYDLAPYAAGFVEASISYSTKNTFKITL